MLNMSAFISLLRLLQRKSLMKEKKKYIALLKGSGFTDQTIIKISHNSIIIFKGAC